MGGITAPRTQGWLQGSPQSRGHHRYSTFRLARMCPGCAAAPLACNITTQDGDGSPLCCVLPAAHTSTAANSFDKQHFELNAPALKSTNANLWQAWHLQFSPQLHSGGFGYYDSADLAQATFMFKQLQSIGVSFYISDNTNGKTPRYTAVIWVAFFSRWQRCRCGQDSAATSETRWPRPRPSPPSPRG